MPVMRGDGRLSLARDTAGASRLTVQAGALARSFNWLLAAHTREQDFPSAKQNQLQKTALVVLYSAVFVVMHIFPTTVSRKKITSFSNSNRFSARAAQAGNKHFTEIQTIYRDCIACTTTSTSGIFRA